MVSAWQQAKGMTDRDSFEAATWPSALTGVETAWYMLLDQQTPDLHHSLANQYSGSIVCIYTPATSACNEYNAHRVRI